MNGMPEIDPSLFDQASPELQAAVAALVLFAQEQIQALQQQVLDLQQQVLDLQQQVLDLQQQLNLNSSNSSKPPSSDPPGAKLKPRPKAPPSGRKPGGQPGHPKHFRTLVPPERLRSSVDCHPDSCRRCGHALAGDDPDPLVHQVADLPEVSPLVDQYRLHRLTCPHCQTSTCGELPDGVPSGGFGPRLQAFIVLLGGAFRMSKRQIQQLLADAYRLDISLGAISDVERQAQEVLATPVEELHQAAYQAKTVHADETSWREGRSKVWLWVAVTNTVTVFLIAVARSGLCARRLLGDPQKSNATRVVVCDRWSAYGWAAIRQWCWAHLRRDFQAMIDRGGESEKVGEKLLQLSNRLFSAWHKYSRGAISWSTFQGYANQVKALMRLALRQGVECGHARTAGTCRELLAGEENLWTFTRIKGVEPTNNAAERAVRHGVIMRKISGGTKSENGSRYMERLLSVVMTCRQQRRGVLDYLINCFQAKRQGESIPSLLS